VKDVTTKKKQSYMLYVTVRRVMHTGNQFYGTGFIKLETTVS
jgi:hypothetical protein